MYYTYVLRSKAAPGEIYIGFTGDLETRLASHNAGESRHTSKFMPWRLAFYAAFETEQSARDFERFLKTHSGRLLIRKRLLSRSVRLALPEGRPLAVIVDSP